MPAHNPYKQYQDPYGIIFWWLFSLMWGKTKATCTDCAVFFHLLSIKRASPGCVFLYSTVLSLVAIDCWNWKALWHPSEWQKQQIPTKDVCLPGCKLPTGLPRAEQTACFVQLEEPKWKLSIWQSFSKDSIHLEPHRQFQCFTTKTSSIDLSRILHRCLVGTSGDSHHWHHYQNDKWAGVHRMEASLFLMWLHIFSDFSFSLLSTFAMFFPINSVERFKAVAVSRSLVLSAADDGIQQKTVCRKTHRSIVTGARVGIRSRQQLFCYRSAVTSTLRLTSPIKAVLSLDATRFCEINNGGSHLWVLLKCHND